MEDLTEADLMPASTGQDPKSVHWGRSLGFSKKDAKRLIGAVLYAYQYPDGVIKIGYTAHLQNRSHRFADAKLLAICPGTRSDETEVHRSLHQHVAHGREYYHPVPEVLTVINRWRERCGLDLL